ncbi:MAG: hypothetical protein IT258_05155 [Saprospiraceae bacterium]|nr:hypothetical protein [Saprospiraceae bacterium]
MKKLLYLMAFATLFAACNPHHFDANTFIHFKKDPCFGVCPVYSFKVDGTGKATFNGVRNTAKIGTWNRQLTPEATNALFEAFEASNFEQFKDTYTAQVTDLPTTWVTYKTAAFEKTIKDYYGAPLLLKQLEKMVETIAEEETDWKR